MPAIDLNADIGESFGRWSVGDDAALLEIVSSASIACGAHAGDPSSMRRAAELAARQGVTIGAHVAYPDLAGFGRRFIDIDPLELRDSILYQLGALDAFAQVAGAGVAFVKPHGALYHACSQHAGQAEAVAAAVHEFDPALALLAGPGALVLERAEQLGLEPIPEGFADRRYCGDGSLVDRRQPGAMIDELGDAVAQAVSIASQQQVVSIDGDTIELRVRSLCVHGDSVGAVALARAVRAGLTDAGVGVHSFAL